MLKRNQPRTQHDFMAKEQFEIYFFGSGTVEVFSFSFGWMREHHTEDKTVFIVKRTFPEALAELGAFGARSALSSDPVGCLAETNRKELLPFFAQHSFEGPLLEN